MYIAMYKEPYALRGEVEVSYYNKTLDGLMQDLKHDGEDVEFYLYAELGSITECVTPPPKFRVFKQPKGK